MKRRGFIGSGLILAGSLLIPNNAFGLENIVGNVKNVLTERPVEDAVLKFSNYPSGEPIEEYRTDSKGIYVSTITGIKPTPWAEVKLLFDDIHTPKVKLEKRAQTGKFVKAEITHPDYHNAIRYMDISQGNFDVTIIPKSFDIEFFDAWARGSGKGLKRWGANPKFYINTTLAESSQINLVKEIINVDLTEFTNGFVNATVEETTEQKNERESVYIYWVETAGYYDNHDETIENNEITSVSTWFSKSNQLRRVYLRQLTQCLGFLNNGVSGKDFWTNDGHYTQQGLDCGKFLYNSKPGNISPDTNPAPI